MEIMINPDRVDALADNIVASSKNMQQIMGDIDRTGMLLRKNFEDNVANEFESGMKTLFQDFNSFVEQIPSFVETAHTHAANMRKIGG